MNEVSPPHPHLPHMTQHHRGCKKALKLCPISQCITKESDCATAWKFNIGQILTNNNFRDFRTLINSLINCVCNIILKINPCDPERFIFSDSLISPDCFLKSIHIEFLSPILEVVEILDEDYVVFRLW